MFNYFVQRCNKLKDTVAIAVFRVHQQVPNIGYTQLLVSLGLL